jgi:hypothetical protein
MYNGNLSTVGKSLKNAPSIFFKKQLTCVNQTINVEAKGTE